MTSANDPHSSTGGVHRAQFADPAPAAAPAPVVAPSVEAPRPHRAAFAAEPPRPPQAQPAPAAPRRATFAPEPPRAPPSTPAPVAPRRAQFTDNGSAPAPRPSSQRPSGPPSVHRAFDNPLNDQERRALEHVRQVASELFQKAPQAVEGCIRQLLPFSLTTLTGWGDSALADNAQLVTDMAHLQRGFSGLNVNELIAQALESARPNQSFLKRVLGNKVSLNAFRVRATGLRVQIDQIMPQMDELRQRALRQSDRLPILLAAMSAAASVGADRLDPALDTAVQNRRTVLTQAVQQAQLVLPQIDEMRRQLVEQSSRIVEFINVTLPAMEMAAAQS